MHEEAFIAHYEEIRTVAFQVVFFLTVFHTHTSFKNILLTLAHGALALWLSATLTQLHVIGAGALGLVVGILTNLRGGTFDKLPIAKYGVYYLIIQPVILYYTLPMFIPQTNYPIGYVIGALIWTLVISMVVYTSLLRALAIPFFRRVGILTLTCLFLGFWCFDTIWAAVSLCTGIQLLMIYIPN